MLTWSGLAQVHRVAERCVGDLLRSSGQEAIDGPLMEASRVAGGRAEGVSGPRCGWPYLHSIGAA